MTSATSPTASRPPRHGIARPVVVGAILVAVLALGGAGGVAAHRYLARAQPQSVLLLQPAPIEQMTDASPVAIRGQVAEIFGNKFIVQDDSGRALVDTGPRGINARPVDKGEIVTVQGRFDDGFVHADVLTRADGTSEAYGPPRPRHGPGDEPGRRGPGPGREPPPPAP